MRLPSVDRVTFLGAAMGFVGVVVLFRMVNIQSSASIQDMVESTDMENSYYNSEITPERGLIYDRWGNLLAGNRIAYDITMDLISADLDAQAIQEERDQVDSLMTAIMSYIPSESLNPNVDLNQIYDYAMADPGSVELVPGIPTQNVTIARNAYGDSINILISMLDNDDYPGLSRLHAVPHLIRTYPENSLASAVVGYYNSISGDNSTGLFGVEEYYDTMLRSTTYNWQVSYDPTQLGGLPNVSPGTSLVLTIDSELQNVVEDILDQAVETYGAQSGVIIVEDPRTGEILAMANSQRIDLNHWSEYVTDDVEYNWRHFNEAIAQPYEPGSVMKVLTMAAALNAGVVTPDTIFNDLGYFSYGGITISNWDGEAYGQVTMRDCMAYSLNTCLSTVAVEYLGLENLTDYLEAFGIGRPTNIDMAGEYVYPMITFDSGLWHDSRFTYAYGQGINVTPIQMVAAISAIANDGIIMPPHVVRSFINSEGVEYPYQAIPIGTPITAETAQTLTNMLADTLSTETSYVNATVDGYRLAGKTGTASVLNEETGRYYSDRTNASFVGWGPADDPQFLVYVWLEEPSSGEWGSIVAAPVFRQVVEQLVVILGIPPDDVRAQLQADGQ